MKQEVLAMEMGLSQQIEKIVALYNEKVVLLERLFESEREKVEILKGRG